MNQGSDQIVQCGECGAKNRIPLDRFHRLQASDEKVKCGRCHQPLTPDHAQSHPTDPYKMRCLDCGAKNRVPADRLDGAAKCGKCGNPLPTDQLFIPQPVMVTDGNFEDKVLMSPLPVLVFAWAPW